MMALALTLSLAMAASAEPAAGPPGAADAAAPPEGEAAAPPTREPVEATASAQAEPRHELRGWRQDLGLGLHSTTFWSSHHHRYTFHDLGLGYLASWGRRGVFVDATGLLPLQGREDGHVYSIGRYYTARYGGDLLTGFQLRWQAFRDAEAEAGIGPHATFLVMKGVSGYRDFSASPLGLGTEARLRWRTGHALSRWPITFAVHASAALDFYDPIHGDDLRHGYTFRAGVSMGLAPGGSR